MTLYPRLRDTLQVELGYRMLLQIHDEVILEVRHMTVGCHMTHHQFAEIVGVVMEAAREAVAREAGARVVTREVAEKEVEKEAVGPEVERLEVLVCIEFSRTILTNS